MYKKGTLTLYPNGISLETQRKESLALQFALRKKFEYLFSFFYFRHDFEKWLEMNLRNFFFLSLLYYWKEACSGR